MTDFETRPDAYVHWKLEIEGPVARLLMNVDPEKTFRPGYKLKLNSYDLGVDIELADAVQRLRFEHPSVKVVVITSANPRIFCAGANIHMLVSSSHPFKVNFCKFTNDTRCAIEDATEHSGQRYIAALNGTSSGGGYELASACAEIYLVDDGNSAVSLPEIPLLGVLPGTGGLTRLVDKRKIRRDLADVFSTLAEGLKARRAKEWGFIDGAFPRSRFDEEIGKRAAELAARPSPKDAANGVALRPIAPKITLTKAAESSGSARSEVTAASSAAGAPGLSAPAGVGGASAAWGSLHASASVGAATASSAPGSGVASASTGAAAGSSSKAPTSGSTSAVSNRDTVLVEYRYVTLKCDRGQRLAELTVAAPEGPQPETLAGVHEAGADFWPLRAFREIDDALCRLRLDEEEIGLVLLRTRGGEEGRSKVLAIERLLAENRGDWLVNEIVLLMARVLRRLDLTAKSLFAMAEGESCFAGSLLEMALAADRIYMKNDAANQACFALGTLSSGLLPMPNGLSRLRSRFLADPAKAERLEKDLPSLDTPAALAAGLATFAPDDLDWEEETRVAIEERLSLSPDALTGMEASLRFGGPETTESKIYGRLSAWQNWIFIRPNATGEHGALKLYGQPERPKFDWRRT